MGPGERPAAELGVARPSQAAHGLDERRSLAVPELADVEVARDAVDARRSRNQPSMMSLADCISRWPSTTRWPWLANLLLPRKGSSTDAWASLICRNSGSSPSLPSMSTTQARVPTLPTPTTLRAAST